MERLAILQMVASGKVSPEEGTELLAALEAVPGRGTTDPAGADQASASAFRFGWAWPPKPPVPPAPQGGGITLRVHCELDEQACDFSVPLDAAAEIPEMLPPDLADHIPSAMLRQLSRLAELHTDGDLLRYQHDEFELVVRREQEGGGRRRVR